MSRQGPNGRQQKREGSEINRAGDPGHKPAWSAQGLEEGPRATEVTEHKVTQVAFCCSVKSIYWSSTVSADSAGDRAVAKVLVKQPEKQDVKQR